MRITYAAAISRDGFIAREDGDVGWLDDFTVDPRASGLEALFADVDGLVMGRQTYDFIFDYGTWPYRDKLSWVCTHRPLQPLAGANLIVADDIDQVIESAAARRFSHLWLLGRCPTRVCLLSQATADTCQSYGVAHRFCSRGFHSSQSIRWTSCLVGSGPRWNGRVSARSN